MSIKPAFGWLALLLFTTAARADGPRELSRSKSPKGTVTTPVTAKTKAPPPLVQAHAVTSPTLALIDNVKPTKDYEAEIYSGVPLDGSLAKLHGYDHGLVLMVFDAKRQGGFRVPHEQIHRQLRFTGEQPHAHVDVLDTEGGVVIIDTVPSLGGMFTTSEVFAFPKHASLERRIGALESLTNSARERVRQAMVAAEWAPTPH